MTKEELISIFKLAHGSYNSLVYIGFLVQAALGLRIRLTRRAGTPRNSTIRRHRTFGPVLAALGILGGLSGPIITYLDKGRVIEYLLHFTGGLTVVTIIIAVFLASRAIKGREPGPRTVHMGLGILLLMAYGVQAVFGLGILL
jgi:hypothetical protein